MDNETDESVTHRYAAQRLTIEKAPNQLDRIEQKVDTLTRVLNDLLVMLGEDTPEEPELPSTTLDGVPMGAPREEGQSLG